MDGALVGWMKNNIGTKKVQRGTTAGAGAVSIDQVNMEKTFVKSVSKGSAGYVAARGNITLTPTGGSIARRSSPYSEINDGFFPTYSGSITDGTTDLTVKQYSAKLQDETHIYADGPVEYEVVESY